MDNFLARSHTTAMPATDPPNEEPILHRRQFRRTRDSDVPPSIIINILEIQTMRGPSNRRGLRPMTSVMRPNQCTNMLLMEFEWNLLGETGKLTIRNDSDGKSDYGLCV